MQPAKKLAQLLFDFDVVSTMNDDCDQQVPSVAVRLKQLTTPVVIQHQGHSRGKS